MQHNFDSVISSLGSVYILPNVKYFAFQIWFQNKRARWRRRVNHNMNSPANHFMPVSPVLPQVTPYGLMQTPFVSSSPSQGMLGFFNGQASYSPYTNQLANNQFANNQGHNRLANTQGHHRLLDTNQAIPNQQSSPLSLTPASYGMSSNYGTVTSATQTMATNNYRQLQYSYPTSFGMFPQS